MQRDGLSRGHVSHRRRPGDRRGARTASELIARRVWTGFLEPDKLARVGLADVPKSRHGVSRKPQGGAVTEVVSSATARRGGGAKCRRNRTGGETATGCCLEGVSWWQICRHAPGLNPRAAQTLA